MRHVVRPACAAMFARITRMIAGATMRRRRTIVRSRRLAVFARMYAACGSPCLGRGTIDHGRTHANGEIGWYDPAIAHVLPHKRQFARGQPMPDLWRSPRNLAYRRKMLDTLQVSGVMPAMPAFIDRIARLAFCRSFWS